MSREQCEGMASVLGGTAWHTGGGIWCVRIDRGAGDGSFVVVSDHGTALYASEDEWYAGRETVGVWW